MVSSIPGAGGGAAKRGDRGRPRPAADAWSFPVDVAARPFLRHLSARPSCAKPWGCVARHAEPCPGTESLSGNLSRSRLALCYDASTVLKGLPSQRARRRRTPVPAGPVPGPLGRSPRTPSAKKEGRKRVPDLGNARKEKQRPARPFPLSLEGGKQNDASYLVDPASSHMLVSKIKPCMCKYRLYDGETANGSLDQLWFLRSYNPTWITVAILELIHADDVRPSREDCSY